MKSLICGTFSLFCLCAILFHSVSTKHTDVILLGSTGDLARKYLWQGFFELFHKHHSVDQTFQFYACGRSSIETAREKLNDILMQNIFCTRSDDVLNGHCEITKTAFKEIVTYSQLKSDQDFQTLAKQLQKARNSREGEIIFYLSIPPEAYKTTAQSIYTWCYPQDKTVQLRIVFEKPFGHDLLSASQLVSQLSEYFTEEEVYRIDHYLGKSIVREILPFRKENPFIDNLLNKDNVERIEIVLKETVDAKGRFNYYNQNGVIRDILQNHLMEVLALVTMEIPEENTRTSDLKLKLLKQIEIVRSSSVLTGQYSQYLNQSLEEMQNFKMADTVPTFAAVLLSIKATRWMDVPVIFVSGKSLDKRESYVKIVFKRNVFYVSKHKHSEIIPEIVFYIGHEDLKSPMILVSKYFQDVRFPDGISPNHNINQKDIIDASKFSDFFTGVPVSNTDAYCVLIEDIFRGKKANFIGSNHLLILWKIWDDVIKELKQRKPRLYASKDVKGVLNFRIYKSRLEFVKPESTIDQNSFIYSKEQTPITYLGHKLVCSEEEFLIHSLAKDIVESIKTNLKTKDSYHIAFSGGRTPSKLFQIITQFYSDISWELVHVWQVDERCQGHKSEQSNFYHLWNNLLQHVSIPYDNIHPMPVDIYGNICHRSDKGDNSYAKSIRYYLPDVKFDYVVLGLGSDGHTASLFPNSKALHSKNLVTMATKNRMTLTLSTINLAHHVSILVTGKEKHEILQKLETSGKSWMEFPILGVKPINNQLTWYIDNEAYFSENGPPVDWD